MLKLTLLIKSKSLQPLVLNEAYDSTPTSKKYIFSGVFTACSVPGHVVINRNNRSYPEQEVLKHLGYLRESILQNGCILGELDHPEGRFDVLLKEASHKITDLWYDQNTHCVMGKLELLDTPNGRIAQELVESKYPLFVSSRAAGDVDEKTHEVTIAQIFTYDIVCTPGFAEAKLQQVSESLNISTLNYLTESINNTKNVETNKKYKVLIEGVSVTETEQVAPINERSMKMKEQPINLKDLSTPLLEEDEFKLPEADTNPTASSEDKKDEDKKDATKSDNTEDKKEDTSKKEEVKESDEEKTDDKSSDDNDSDDSSDDSKDSDDSSDDSSDEDKNEDLTDDEKKANRALILDIVGIDADGDESSDDNEDSDKEEKREEIVDIEPVEDDNDDDDLESDMEEDVELSGEKAKKIEAETKKNMEKFQDVLNNLSKVESVKESIIALYPFSQSLSPENFARFAALTPVQKRKCMRFVVENSIFDIKSINELWATPLNEERRLLKNWLRLASPEDIALYTDATLEEQNAIENMARYCILETKQDVEEFWDKCGLRQRAARKRMNEAFVERYKVVQKPIQYVQETTHPLGYNMDFIAMTEELYNM